MRKSEPIAASTSRGEPRAAKLPKATLPHRARYRHSYVFPKHFTWGVATAAAQIEGAALADGKGESIWDRFAKTRNIDTPTVACDHYARYRDDVALMADLRIPNYRFSVSWPRIFPSGDGTLNEKGLDFYDRLVDELLRAGITPWLTLYHWDLPQALEDRGGWRTRSTVDAFSRYARVVVRRLSDRVNNWMTLNEILRFVPGGYGFGWDAPGAKEPASVINQIYHHTLLAHGYAVEVVRELGSSNARVGLAHNPPVPIPVTETESDILAARSEYRRQTEQLMSPLYWGTYSETLIERLGPAAPKMARGDLAIISRKTDFLGLNVYMGDFVRRGSDGQPEQIALPAQYPKADIPWLGIMPQAIYWAIRHAHDVYGVPTMYITENGAPYLDRLLPSGEVHDLGRREFLRNNLVSLHRAIQEGFDVRGYFLWSLLDNYEWAEGYAKRFGIVYTDYQTFRRVPKLSARWYTNTIQHNQVM